MSNKPFGYKSYGHIPHLSTSKLGTGDHKCDIGQERIATKKILDKWDRIIIQEKLDGSNVGVGLLNGVLLPIVRAGYLANTSPWKMHQIFNDWVWKNADRFLKVLKEGERICGEWLYLAHGTRYKLPHEPFVMFDIMTKDKRVCYDELIHRNNNEFTVPKLISDGPAMSADQVMKKLGTYGFHGALDPVEGAVWRAERQDSMTNKWEVSFLVKHVRSDKQDGCYLPEQSGQKDILNEWPAGSL